MPSPEARWYEREAKGLRCRLCPRDCLIREGESGVCRVRQNLKGTLRALSWGRFPALASDPLEKKPLYHFYPGEPCLSLGTLGCNLRCLHCQNDSLSDPSREALDHLAKTKIILPAEAVRLARSANSRVIAWTYNEPLINFEYLSEALPQVREAGLKTVLVTAGVINPQAFKSLLPNLDACSVDLKGWGDEFYRRLTGLKGFTTLLENIRLAHRAGVHIELVTNLISDWNDDSTELKKLASWIVNELDPEVPWHLTASRPANRLLSIRPTPNETIERALKIGEEAGLKHIYAGNLGTSLGQDSHCSECQTLLIRRRGFGFVESRLGAGSACPACGKKLRGEF